MESRKEEIEKLEELKKQLEYYKEDYEEMDRKIREKDYLDHYQLQDMKDDRNYNYRQMLNIQKQIEVLKLGKIIK